MKISSSSPTSGSKPVDRAKKGARSSDASFSLDSADKADEAGPVATSAPVGPIASVQALLALQETDGNPAEGRSKGLKRGHELLDMLEGLRRAILLGVISLGDLRRLADMARGQREGTGDKTLDSILQEIELRAEVELAKYEQ